MRRLRPTKFSYIQTWIEKLQIAQKLSKPIQFTLEQTDTFGHRWFHAIVNHLKNGDSVNPRFAYVVEKIKARIEQSRFIQVQQEKLISSSKTASLGSSSSSKIF